MANEAFTSDQVLGLLQMRLENCKTQKELAHKLGVSQQYLGDVLAGRRGLGDRILSKMGMYKEEVFYFSSARGKK